MHVVPGYGILRLLLQEILVTYTITQQAPGARPLAKQNFNIESN